MSLRTTFRSLFGAAEAAECSTHPTRTQKTAAYHALASSSNMCAKSRNVRVSVTHEAARTSCADLARPATARPLLAQARRLLRRVRPARVQARRFLQRASSRAW